MKRKRWLLGLILFTAVAVCAGLMLPVRVQRTNCGGNSAALYGVESIVNVARMSAGDAPDHTFLFAQASPQERQSLARYSTGFLVRGAHFLVTRKPVLGHDPEPRRVIVVCDRTYRNVPQREFGSSPPTHAAAFADGTTGLISPAEFAALDCAAFIPLDELCPPKGD